MDLNKLKEEAYAIAKEHGWHDEEYSDEHFLMLIISEIAEAVQADRDGRRAGRNAFEKYELQGMDFSENCGRHIIGTVEDELADIMIRCLDLAGLRGVSLGLAKNMLASIKKEAFNTAPGCSFTESMYKICCIITCSEEEGLQATLCGIIVAIHFVCWCMGIEIGWFVEQKMKYNRIRPYKHGGKKY